MLHWFLTIIATPISASYCRKTMYYGCTESRESDIVEIGNWYTAPILLVLLIPFLIGILLHHAFLLVYIRWIKAFLHERCCSHYLKWRRDWCKYHNISICDAPLHTFVVICWLANWHLNITLNFTHSSIMLFILKSLKLLKVTENSSGLMYCI